ncbi:MAG: hypothetical protein U5Q16_02445 [Gammaproteobacteria bacterium]|nr:hypothetical protein [Gammaproteobacteria bacterium]
MTVDDEWGYSAGFLSALASLVRELEQKEIAVYEVAYSYLSFGSWSAVVGTRHRRLRFDFDGKETELRIAEARFSDSRSLADWKSLPAPALEAGSGVNFQKLFELVKEIAKDTFSDTAGTQ